MSALLQLLATGVFGLAVGQAEPAEVSPRAYLEKIRAAPVWEHAALAQEALGVYPDHPQFLLILGRGLYYQGEWRKARQALEAVVEKAPREGRYLRGAARLSLAILDSYEPQKRRLAYGEILQLLDGEALTRADRIFAYLAAARTALALGDQVSARRHLGVLQAVEDQLEPEMREMLRAEELQLALAEGRFSDARRLLPELAQASNRIAWFFGVLARLFLDQAEGLEELLAQVPVVQLPGNARACAEALRRGLRGEPWRPLLERQLQEFPYDAGGYLVGAWLGRREGDAGWASSVKLGAAQLPHVFWLRPPWVQGVVP